ncbi:hypothetical protein D3C87_1964420 [compost metagenome]
MIEQAEGELDPFRLLGQPVVDQRPDFIRRAVCGGGGLGQQPAIQSDVSLSGEKVLHIHAVGDVGQPS